MKDQQLKRIGKTINFIGRLSPAMGSRMAFYLFSKPRPRRQKEIEARFLATARSFQLPQGTLKIQAYEWGEPNAPLILFAHGWESNAGRWRSFVPPLVEQGYRVVAFDAPAHGASEGKHVHLVSYSETIGSFKRHFGDIYAVVGHSLGGSAAILAMTPSNPMPQKAVILGSFSSSRNVFIGYQKMLGLSDQILDGLFTIVEKMSGRSIDYYTMADRVQELPAMDALIIHDTDDLTAHVSEARSLNKSWSSARYHETSGYGHSLQGTEIVEKVVDFLT